MGDDSYGRQGGIPLPSEASVHVHQGPLVTLGPAPSTRSTKPHPVATRRKGFACPYRQKHPRWTPLASSCLHSFTIHRLKEHLYRCHMKAYECPRCYGTFPTKDLLQTHLRAAEICTPSEKPETRIFGTDTKLLLKKRPSSNTSNEARWNELYHVLFPDDMETPCPYHDEAPLAEFREYSNRVLPEIFMEQLNSSITTLSEATKKALVQIVRASSDNVLSQFQQDQKDEEATLESSASSAQPNNYPTDASFVTPLDMRNEFDNTDVKGPVQSLDRDDQHAVYDDFISLQVLEAQDAPREATLNGANFHPGFTNSSDFAQGVGHSTQPPWASPVWDPQWSSAQLPSATLPPTADMQFPQSSSSAIENPTYEFQTPSQPLQGPQDGYGFGAVNSSDFLW